MDTFWRTSNGTVLVRTDFMNGLPVDIGAAEVNLNSTSQVTVFAKYKLLLTALFSITNFFATLIVQLRINLVIIQIL